MEDQKKMIKDDINFLEYPNWVLNSRNSINTWVVEKADGRYEMTSLKGMPSHFDKTILYYLLYKLFKETDLNKFCLVTNRYELAKNIFFNTKNVGKNHYDRIMAGLKKWKQITINFEGVFYEDGHYIIKYFSIIDDVTLDKESGKLSIRFGQAYIEQLRETKFYRYIDFEKYKKLNRASSARLYEILAKSFKDRNEWSINMQNLAEKLTFEKKDSAKAYYPSEVLRQIKPALNEINKKTDLYVTLHFNKKTGVCVFKKIKKPKGTIIPARRIAEEKAVAKPLTNDLDLCLEFFSNLPQDERFRIEKAVSHDPIFAVLPDQKTRVFSYMRNKGLWPAAN